MTPAEYAAAQLPATPTILGVALRPFALGHGILLDRLESPFAWCAQPEEAPGLGDLLLALEICRHEPFHIPSAVRLRLLKWWHRNISPEQLQEAVTAFESHVKAAFKAPVFWKSTDEQERDSGVPILLSLKVGLMSRLKMTEETALKTPVRLALQEIAGLSALAGRIELITEEDQLKMAQAAALKESEAV
jgi:hypothetical protein